MALITGMLPENFYIKGSLKSTGEGISFSLKNEWGDIKIKECCEIILNDQSIEAGKLLVKTQNSEISPYAQVNACNTLSFPFKATVTFIIPIEQVPEGEYTICCVFETDNEAKLDIEISDRLNHKEERQAKLPKNAKDNYAEQIIRDRQAFVENYTKTSLHHVSQYSFDPHIAQGNCESFTGVAQVPLGFAGPLRVNGEHAQGEFLIPMATSEGTLIASYHRGMAVLNHSGGVKATVLADVMQRAPVFIFDDARGARDFAQWIQTNLPVIKQQAEATSSVAKLLYIDTFLSNKFAFLRFNFSTGDAAGQNMVGKATFAACSWILEHYQQDSIINFFLESNFATDKKASQVNIMRTRGKRVVAECIVKRDVLIKIMRVKPEQLVYHEQVANVGAFISGANNNGLHSANGITAMFIATGQDVANVAESSAGVIYSELTPEQDLYISITIPSLIVATYGGGTGLATQKECLETLGCYGKGKVHKLAEIIAGVVLAGEISLASAISSSDWVSSHEKYGRNR